MEKKSLGVIVQERLKQEYGSTALAAKSLGLPYDNLKKAILNNRFSSPQLGILFPSESAASLQAEYDFKLTRSYRREFAPQGITPSVFRFYTSLGLEPEDIRFISENNAVGIAISLTVKRECKRLRQVLAPETNPEAT